MSMHRTASAVGLVGLAAGVRAGAALPAYAVPERVADAGTVVWCDGEGGSLTAGSTTRGGTSWSAGVLADEAFAFASGSEALLAGSVLAGTFTAYDDRTGAALGDLEIDGAVTRGETEVLSGWSVDDDGRRRQTEGTRAPLSGAVTLSLGSTEVTLTCTGWEFDTETFVLTRSPGTDVATGWWPDSYALDGGGGSIGFYGDRQHELGIALDLPSSFGGERLQIRNGYVDGSLLLRDPDTWEVTGVAVVRGVVTETGREQSVESGAGYRQVTELVHYDVALTISSSQGEFAGTWSATHETGRTLNVIPPKAL